MINISFAQQRIILVVLACLLLITLPSSAEALLTVPSTSTGTYTVSWTNSSGGQTRAYLYETAEGGATAKYTVTGANSKSFSKGPGTYSYRLQLCFYEPEIRRELCGRKSNAVTVTVTPEPSSSKKVEHVVIIAIDGLKPDVLSSYLQSQESNGGALREITFNRIEVKSTTVFPSVTLTAWASMVTGVWPDKHGILGNEWFDRIILDKKERTRSYTATSVKAYNDVLRVYGFCGCGGAQDDQFPWVADVCVSNAYRDGLANRDLQAKTIYEYATEAGLKSAVSYHMYWKPLQWGKPDNQSTSYIHPSREDLKDWEGYSKQYDTHAIDKAIQYLNTHEMPHLFTIYLSGLDHRSHERGNQYQIEMLKKYDNGPNPIIPKLVNALKAKGVYENTVFIVVSDHGHTDTNGDDAHSIVLKTLFDDEMKDVVEDSKYDDVYDDYGYSEIPSSANEEERYDSVVVLNSGMAGIYIKQRTDSGDPIRWRDGSTPVWPRFEKDVFHVVKWINRHRDGGAYKELFESGTDAVEEILVALRTTTGALYRIVRKTKEFSDCIGPVGPEGLYHCGLSNITTLHPEYVDPVRRIERYGYKTRSPDIILLPKYRSGFHFSGENVESEHGSLYPNDSFHTFVICGVPIGRGETDGRVSTITSLQSIVDVAPTVAYLLGFKGDFDGKSVLRGGCYKGKINLLMTIEEPGNWYQPFPSLPPMCRAEADTSNLLVDPEGRSIMHRVRPVR